MALPDPLLPLLDTSSYPHSCTRIELIETHISWVLLTGSFAYKLKKPVQFSFVDFSTLALREHFCREELRCNRAFAPHLYLDVVSVCKAGDGLRVVPVSEASASARADTVEWAVKMRQFDPAQGLDRLLERNALEDSALDAFGADLAACHDTLPRLDAVNDAVVHRIFAPVTANFDDIESTALGKSHAALLGDVRVRSSAAGEALKQRLTARVKGGYVRECHGDLHLSNLALIDAQVTAFDCLEFNADLRWVDTINDLAFLFMDCHFRGKVGMAYRVLDSYLDAGGDYQGAELLSYYGAYRSMVRAKVAALRFEQAAKASVALRFEAHLEWARDRLARPCGTLVLTCGLSGSGKSYLAKRLVPRLPAVRLRSDVARKHRSGMAPSEHSHSQLNAGLYSAKHTDETYAWLSDRAAMLLAAGENVIVDATFIERAQRRRFLDMAARIQAPAVVVHRDAADSVLTERIRRRAARRDDPSEATPEVLDFQRGRFEPPGDDEPVITLDAEGDLTEAVLDQLVSRLKSSAR